MLVRLFSPPIVLNIKIICLNWWVYLRLVERPLYAIVYHSGNACGPQQKYQSLRGYPFSVIALFASLVSHHVRIMKHPWYENVRPLLPSEFG